MLQVTYISTVHGGTPAGLLANILAVSRRNNAADDVTGLLMFDGRRFLQALEGEADMVERTFARIKADPRHRAIVRLSTRDVAAREFGAWAMATTAPDDDDGAAFIARVDALTQSVPDANVRAQFRSFARLRRDAA